MPEASTPESVPVRRSRYTVLVGSVIFMAVILLVGLGVVVSTIIFRAQTHRAGADQALLASGGGFGIAELPIGHGDRLMDMQLNGDRLALHIGNPQFEEVVLVDARTGRETGRIRLRVPTDFAGNN
ncbi:MAG: hypothetical protein PW790_06985 [Parvibaculaceae bacterium]|nr:hypothetical protein [Parvibaculaceae bacterium]